MFSNKNLRDVIVFHRMEWFYFASIAAVSFGLLAAVSKKLMENTNVYVFTALVHLLGLAIYIPYFLYVLEVSNLVLTGILVALASGVANMLGVYLYNTSIKLGELSEEIPLTRLSPVFTAVLGVLILGETVNLSKGAGIALVTVGSIVIVQESGHSIKDSFKKIFTKKAAKMAVASSIVYAFASIMDRVGTQILAPELYTFFIYVTIASIFTILALKHKDSQLKNTFKQNKLLYILSGGLTIIGSLAVFQAFSMAEASLVVPILQIQVFMAIGLGGLYFKEKEILMKILGSLILIVGIILIV